MSSLTTTLLGVARKVPVDDRLQRFELLAGVCPRLSTKRGNENVGLAPEHALRHTRRAAGVQNVEIIRRERGRRCAIRHARECGLVVDGSRKKRSARAIVYLQQDFEQG